MAAAAISTLDRVLASAELPKAAAFLEQLRRLRERARWLPLHKLVQLVCEETRLEEIFSAMDNGRRRCSNLRAFQAFAAAAGDQTSLMRFLDDVENRRQRGMGLMAEEAGSSGAVRIMSVHKSKGLEFPVVILADLSRRFNLEDLRQNVMTHPKLLAGSNVTDRNEGIRFPTIAKRAISLCLRQESISEELRVLYVAMTRAKCRLIMTYCSKYLPAELQAVSYTPGERLPAETAGQVKNPGMWILAAAMRRTEAGELFAKGGFHPAAAVREYPWKICVHSSESTLDSGEMLTADDSGIAAGVTLPDAEEIRRKLRFCYPFLKASTVPSKVTATQLKGRNLDREASEDAAAAFPLEKRPLYRPQFVRTIRGLSPAEKGTANHLFLQFASYEACTTPEGVEGEVSRLVQGAFLSPEQGDAVQRGQILQLFASPLGQRILKCPQAVREMKFSLLVDGEFYDLRAAGEQIMLQGVVDCLLVEPEGLTVIDFKTDRIAPGREAERASVYAGQLNAYAMAMERIYGKPVRQRLLYFFSTGQTVELPPTEL